MLNQHINILKCCQKGVIGWRFAVFGLFYFRFAVFGHFYFRFAVLDHFYFRFSVFGPFLNAGFSDLCSGIAGFSYFCPVFRDSKNLLCSPIFLSTGNLVFFLFFSDIPRLDNFPFSDISFPGPIPAQNGPIRENKWFLAILNFFLSQW